MRISIFRPGFTPNNEPGGPGQVILAGRFPKSSYFVQYFADAAPGVFETPPGFLRHGQWLLHRYFSSWNMGTGVLTLLNRGIAFSPFCP